MDNQSVVNKIYKGVLDYIMLVFYNLITDLFPEVIKKLPQSKYLIRLKKKDKKKHYFGI